jgi:hypothetical protein
MMDEKDFDTWVQSEARLLVPFRTMSDADLRNNVEAALWAYIWPLIRHKISTPPTTTRQPEGRDPSEPVSRDGS